MKKIYMIVAIMVTLVFSACDGTVDTNSYPLVQPTAEYEVDTWGSNSEVYEFSPKTAPEKTCIVFMLDSGAAMGMQCFDKVK